MKPIRLQLEWPYNYSNETKNTHVWVFKFLYSLHKQYFSVYQHVREAVNESVSERIEWASDSTVHSLVSFLLNQPFWTNRLIWMIQ